MERKTQSSTLTQKKVGQGLLNKPEVLRLPDRLVGLQSAERPQKDGTLSELQGCTFWAVAFYWARSSPPNET